MGEPHREHAPKVSESGELTVAGECAAFLSGEYLDYIREAGALRMIPRAAWMVLNPVAHGTPERVRELASPPLQRDQSQMTWRQCRSRIAAVLLDKCGDDDTDLARLQREALMPLELGLIDEVEVTPQVLSDLSVLALEIQTLPG